MTESVHVGAKEATTHGVSGNPDLVKELLELQKGGKEKKKTAEKENDEQVAKLTKELNDEREKNKLLAEENRLYKIAFEERLARLEAGGGGTTETTKVVDGRELIETTDGEETESEPTTEQARVNEAAEALENSQNSLNDAIEKFASVRVDSERILNGGRSEAELEIQKGNLNEAFEQWADSYAVWNLETNRILFEYREQAKDNRTRAEARLQELLAKQALPPMVRPANLEQSIKAEQDLLKELDDYDEMIEGRIEKSEQELAAIKAQKLIEIRTKVDNAMQEERESRHPQLAKVAKWFKSPKAKFVAGAGLTAIGFAGIATGNAPLALGAFGAARGLGVYNLASGFGERRGKKQMDEAFESGDIESIEDYTNQAGKQSKTRRRSKRVGAAAGAAAAVIPGVLQARNAAAAAEVTHTATPTPEAPIPKPTPPDWLSSREFAEMFHHPITFSKFMNWADTMKSQGYSANQIGEMLSKLPPGPEGFGS